MQARLFLTHRPVFITTQKIDGSNSQKTENVRKILNKETDTSSPNDMSKFLLFIGWKQTSLLQRHTAFGWPKSPCHVLCFEQGEQRDLTGPEHTEWPPLPI